MPVAKVDRSRRQNYGSSDRSDFHRRFRSRRESQSAPMAAMRSQNAEQFSDTDSEIDRSMGMQDFRLAVGKSENPHAHPYPRSAADESEMYRGNRTRDTAR